MMRHRLVDLLFSSLAALAAYVLFAIRDPNAYDYLTIVAYSTDPRPFVFRALLPLLSRVLEGITGLPAVYGLILLAMLSTAGLYFSIKYLGAAFIEDRSTVQMVSFLASGICVGVIALKYPKVYDVATAMLFALSFGLLARGKLTLYFLLFPIVTLNRETSFLLTIFFIVWTLPPSRRWLYGTVYQVFLYLLIRLAVGLAFADHPGAFAIWRPIENLTGYALHPLKSLLALVVIGLLGYMIFRGWSSKPAFLRSAFLVVFPVQVLLYVTVGFPLEFRVFAETLPVVSLLAFWGIRVLFPGEHSVQKSIIQPLNYDVQ